MSKKQVGWCRIKQELVLDPGIISMPWLQDDMDVYELGESRWMHWTPERQGWKWIDEDEAPEVIKLAMMMLV